MKLYRCSKMISLTIIAISLFSSASFAQAASATAKANPTVKVASLISNSDDATFDIAASTAHQYHCELDDSMVLYTNEQDDTRAALRWKDKLYHLSRIETTTGADRFENKQAGLVWIGIPAKAMLFDSIHGQQLANECKTNP